MSHASHRRNRPPCALRLALALCLALLLPLALAGPTDIVLVLDNSGSMRGNDPQFLLKSAVAKFVSALDAETRVGIVIFAEKAAYPVPLALLDVTARATIQRTIDSIDYRGQLTNSPAAIERAIYELKTTARADAGKVIVFMSDGIVDTGDKAVDGEKAEWMRDELATDAADNAIKIFGIAFTDNADFFLIQSLAKKTDGAYFRALKPEDLEGVFATVQQKIAAPPVAAPAPPAVAAPPPAAPRPVRRPRQVRRPPAASPRCCPKIALPSRKWPKKPA